MSDRHFRSGSQITRLRRQESPTSIPNQSNYNTFHQCGLFTDISRMASIIDPRHGEATWTTWRKETVQRRFTDVWGITERRRYLIAVSSSYLMRRIFPDRLRGYKLSFPSMARFRWRGRRIIHSLPSLRGIFSPQMFSARHPTSAPPKRTPKK